MNFDRVGEKFLMTLQERSKWKSQHRNFQFNDIVLMKNDEPQNSWPLARIIKTYPDDKGFVRTVELDNMYLNVRSTDWFY